MRSKMMRLLSKKITNLKSLKNPRRAKMTKKRRIMKKMMLLLRRLKSSPRHKKRLVLT